MSLGERLQQSLGSRYVLERELGQGGMSTVFLAEDPRHRRQVAIKVLRPELATALGPERFSREIQIAARLSWQAKPGPCGVWPDCPCSDRAG